MSPSNCAVCGSYLSDKYLDSKYLENKMNSNSGYVILLEFFAEVDTKSFWQDSCNKIFRERKERKRIEISSQ